MAANMALLLLLAAAPLLGHTATLIQSSDALEEPRLMRKQPSEERVGNFLERAASATMNAASQPSNLNYCMLDFPLGIQDTSQCDDHHGHPDTPIEEVSSCMDAAHAHRGSCHMIDVAYRELHPQGCFSANCSWIGVHTTEGSNTNGILQAPSWELQDWVTDRAASTSTVGQIMAKHADGTLTIAWNDTSRTDVNKTANDLVQFPEGDQCFFFNDYKGGPNGYYTPLDGSGTSVYLGIDGFPVCTRERYILGTADTKGGPKSEGGGVETGGGCRTGFDVIMDRDHCTVAATCMGECIDLVNFNVNNANAEDYNHYPKGCFKHNTNGNFCIAWNPTPNLFPGILPSDPKGIPICFITAHYPHSNTTATAT